MKITDPQVIKQGEQDLIDSVQKDLDLDAVREILKERMSATAMSSRGGQIVVHDNKIAFRLDFEINLNGSLLFDRQGNFIDNAQNPGPESDDMAPLIRERNDQDIPDDSLDLEDGDQTLELAGQELEDLEDEEVLDDDAMDLEDEAADPFGDDDTDPQDLDDDINDILKESRQFWEQKKE